MSPFRDPWLAWHHLLGLGFGALSFTWVLSGVLSFYPLSSSAESDPSSEDVAAFRGGPLDPSLFTRNLNEAVGLCRRSLGAAVVRVELVVAGRAPFYVCRDRSGKTRILRADDASPPSGEVESARLVALARQLGGGAAVDTETVLHNADDYYYPTHFEPDLPFPVLRTRFESGLVTYVDPRTLRVVRRYSRGGAAYRWLYHGLHSLDFPALYRRPRLWHPVIVGLLLSSCLLAASGFWLGLRAALGMSPRPWRTRLPEHTRHVQPEPDAP